MVACDEFYNFVMCKNIINFELPMSEEKFVLLNFIFRMKDILMYGSCSYLMVFNDKFGGFVNKPKFFLMTGNKVNGVKCTSIVWILRNLHAQNNNNEVRRNSVHRRPKLNISFSFDVLLGTCEVQFMIWK